MSHKMDWQKKITKILSNATINNDYECDMAKIKINIVKV